jgi:hypothetical protein
MQTRRRFGRLPLVSVLITLTMVTLSAIGPMATDVGYRTHGC